MRCTRVRSPGARTSTEPELPAAPRRVPGGSGGGRVAYRRITEKESPPRWRPGSLSGRPQHRLADLDRVECRTLAEVVGHRPEQHGVGVGQVAANAPDEHAVGAHQLRSEEHTSEL